MQDALEDGALAHVPVPVHLERDLGGGPVRLGQGNARSLAAGREWGFVESLRENESTGGTELCSESLTAVAFLFALHSVADEGTGERIHNTVTSPDRADHDAHRERGAKITTDTDTAAPSLVQVRERGNARYLPSFAPDPILLSRPFVVSSSEYARPTNVTPTLNGDHRQRATDDGRTERAGGTGSRAHALY